MAVRAQRQATRQIADTNAEVLLRPPFADRVAFDEAPRGRIGSLSDTLTRTTARASSPSGSMRFRAAASIGASS
jgi:alkyl sulfatase BDS1-like metallo-beta-lactamase superfamily hydrolase